MKARGEARIKMNAELGEAKASLIPDSQILKHDPELGLMEKIHVEIEDEMSKEKQSGPLVTLYFQKLKTKLRESDAKNAFSSELMKSKHDKAALKAKQMSSDIRDIKERA